MKRRIGRVLLYVVGALYLATWVWGIPLVHTQTVARVISNYKAVRARWPKDVRSVHPNIRFGASYAVLPFVTVNHYEYHAAALHGWGGFSVDLWYVTGTKRILEFTKWVS